MTNAKAIPKYERPQAIEQRLRDFGRENPEKWMPWKDLLKAVGGSEREFSRMMRAAKEKILAEEAVVANAPDLPEEMNEEFERFAHGMWKRACDIADVNASELRRARQIDRDTLEQERAEHDDKLAALVAERDAFRSELETLREYASDTEEQLNKTRDDLRQARAALEEMRRLFASLTGAAPGMDGQPATDSREPKSSRTRKATTKQSSKKSDDGADGTSASEDPDSPKLPM